VAADLGSSPPSDAEQLLAKASRFFDSQVFRLCRYEVDTDGYPSNALVVEAFRDAVVAQVEWWGELGDSTGAAGVGWGSVEIGSVKLGRSVTAVSGDASPARQVAPEAWDALRSSDLTPDIFELGMVSS
jgi:hypothetical protein